MNPAELFLLTPELFLTLVGMALLMWGAFAGEKATGNITFVACAALALAAASGFFMDAALNIGWDTYQPATTAKLHALYPAVVLLGGHYGVDGFSFLVKELILLSAAGALLISRPFLETSKLARPEYPALVIFATIGLMLMVSSQSLLGLYMGLEMQSLTLYVLASFRRDDSRSTEAGLKYFVLGALASGLLLYGITLIYGASGTILFDRLHTTLTFTKAPIEVTLGFVFIMAAFAFKMSAVPFHMWTPDVYQGSPTPVTAFFASAPKLAAIGLLIKLLMGPFAGMANEAKQILIVLSIGSMAVGAFAALMQNNIKRLLAYSAIGHVGYALLGLVAGGQEGMQAALLYLLIYVPMTLGAFAFLLSLRRDDVYLEQMSDLAGLSKTRPVLAAVMTLFMFSMIGLPPLAGFFGKLYVFLAVINAGYVWIALVGLLLSVVAAFYYLRVIKIMYFEPPKERFDRVQGLSLPFVMGVTAVFLLLFIFAPSLGMDITRAAIQSLTG
jgi:NADH-quinone oxidoreductase subunit N